MPDGKYLSVKHYEEKIPLLWGVDYFTHDIPVFILAPSENYQTWAKYCSLFRIINHYPQLLVCDDNVNIKMAARSSFPSVKIQTCHNHFKENIRRELKVRSDDTYQPFMKRIEDVLGHKLNEESINKKLFALFRDYQHDPVCVSILLNIEKYRAELLAFRGIPHAPLTTNLIECFNSHLQARLASLKGFESFTHARLWLNGFILKRRYSIFTDCTGIFRDLNGKRGVDVTKKLDVDLPRLF